MDFTIFTAGADDGGRRADRIIKAFLPGQSLSSIYKIMRKGLIKVDGKKVSPDEKILEGSQIKIASFLLEKSESASSHVSEKKIDDGLVLFRNEDLLILNKPYDIPVQSGGNSKTTLTDLVLSDWEYSQSERKESLSFKPGPLHRLDRRTSGIIVFSQSLKGAKYFSEGIKNHNIKKTYIALVEGRLSKSEEWNDFIDSEQTANEHSNDFKKVTVRTNLIGESSGEKSARTFAEPLAFSSYKKREVTLVKFKIGTGRKHQIRAQSAFHGHPLLGDTAYGAADISKDAENAGGRLLYLHACLLEFPPENPCGIPQKIECPPEMDAGFSKILKEIGLIP